MRAWRFVALGMAVLWLALHASLRRPGTLVLHAGAGLAIGVAVVWPLRRAFDGTVDLRLTARRLVPFAAYLAIFAKDVVVANVDVAWRVLAPSMPIEPRVVVIPLRVDSEYGVTTIANSITLTPGTLTMDYDEERHALYVHSIWGEDVVGPVRTWEKYAIRMFDEAPGEGER